MRNKLMLLVGFVLLFSMILASCQPVVETKEVQVTVKETVVVEVEGEEQIVEVEKVVTATAAEEEPMDEGPRTLVVCQGQQPDQLYIYGGSMLASSHIQEAVYDGPFDTNSFGYQGVIFEKLPSLADGDAVIETVTVNAGDKMVDDNGDPAELAEGVLYRPAGCASADCAVTYEGSDPVEMDQMVVTFKMVPGLMWSDGEPLTAADSVYSFNTQLDPDTPTGKYTAQRTASYEALDDVTAVWSGLPGYKDSVYFTNFWSPLPEHVYGQYTAAELVEAEIAARTPMGWGAYIIDEWVTGEYIELSKNPNYWRAGEGLPKFDKLVYRFVGENSNANIAGILSGDCDIVDQTSGLEDQSELLLELQAAGELVATFVTGTVWEHIDFNIDPLEGSSEFALSGALKDVRLRQAMLMCMDRQAVVDTVYFGQSIVLDTYLPPEHPLFSTNARHYDFDIEAGIALLEEIGWVDDDGDVTTPRVYQGDGDVPQGTLLETALETTTATARQAATQILADSMTQCGIKVNLNYYPASEWFADGPEGKLFGRRFDLGQFAWLTGVEPSCNLWADWNVPGPEDQPDLYPSGWGGQNETGWRDADYSTVCAAAQQALPGQAAYDENHLKAQEIFAENLPVAPLYLRIKLAATRPDMCGFIMDPTANSEFWNVEEFDYGDCQ